MNNPSPVSSQVATNEPINKVSYPVMIQACVAIAVWALQTYAHTTIPPEVAVSVSLVLSGFVGYITPLRRSEVRSTPQP